MRGDIHSHTLRKGAVYSLSIEELRGGFHLFLSSLPDAESYLFSVGLHPWDVSESWEQDVELVRQCVMHPQVVMIGEAGLDKMTSYEYQIEAFRAQAYLAEEVKKPLVIHCVKAVDELLALYKEVHPAQPWIFHGFRGKPEQAQQLVKAGLYLSFGEHFNEASVRACPLERMFLETDESSLTIEEIAARVEAVRSEK